MRLPSWPSQSFRPRLRGQGWPSPADPVRGRRPVPQTTRHDRPRRSRQVPCLRRRNERGHCWPDSAVTGRRAARWRSGRRRPAGQPGHWGRHGLRSRRGSWRRTACPTRTGSGHERRDGPVRLRSSAARAQAMVPIRRTVRRPSRRAGRAERERGNRTWHAHSGEGALGAAQCRSDTVPPIPDCSHEAAASL